MENLDGTVIATAMPQMARSFGASPVDLNIGMTAYLLALAVFIPISGWLADRFGARPVFAGAIGLFTASSVLCGLSNGLWEFTAARVLQGLGGAMMVPVGRFSFSHRDWRDSVPAPAHVPDWFRYERLHLRLAGFSGLRRQSSDEACDDAGTPSLWISHSANCEWPACGGYDIRLRPILLVHAEGNHCRGAVCRWFI